MLKLPSIWRSLRHRNFRLFMAGQMVSVCGTWMQQVAQAWLAYRLSGSATVLGLVSFSNQIPVLFLGPLAGVASDRFSRRSIVLAAQSLALFQALLLAGLTLLGWIQIWHLIVLGLLQGFILAFDMPARHSLVNDLVEPSDLANAIALNSSMVNAGRIVGPALAGGVVATVGEGFCFLLNGLSYLAVIWALLAMRLRISDKALTHASVLLSLRDGFGYVKRTLPIRDLLLLLALIGLMGMPYITLMPIFASEVFKGGPDTLGVLMSAAGIGALAGSLSLAKRTGVRGLGRLTAVTVIVFGIALILFSLAGNFTLALIVLCVVGFSWMVLIAASNTLLQTLAMEEMRGRVMSLFSVTLVGIAPLGSLFAGALADRIGAPATIAVNGICCFLGGLIMMARLPRLREAALPILAAQSQGDRRD